MINIHESNPEYSVVFSLNRFKFVYLFNIQIYAWTSDTRNWKLPSSTKFLFFLKLLFIKQLSYSFYLIKLEYLNERNVFLSSWCFNLRETSKLLFNQKSNPVHEQKCFVYGRQELNLILFNKTVWFSVTRSEYQCSAEYKWLSFLTHWVSFENLEGL